MNYNGVFLTKNGIRYRQWQTFYSVKRKEKVDYFQIIYDELEKLYTWDAWRVTENEWNIWWWRGKRSYWHLPRRDKILIYSNVAMFLERVARHTPACYTKCQRKWEIWASEQHLNEKPRVMEYTIHLKCCEVDEYFFTLHHKFIPHHLIPRPRDNEVSSDYKVIWHRSILPLSNSREARITSVGKRMLVLVGE